MSEFAGDAEEYKRQGNEAFSAKKYDLAIELYSKAIEANPDSPIYYSNRSACYASKGMWQQALEDASKCVAKDDKFIKGYYRLASAQTELGLFDDANTTLQAALRVEPDNEQLLKQLKVVRARRLAATSKSKAAAPQKQLDEAQRKELMELQEQSSAYMRDLRQVQATLAITQREYRSNQVTLTHLATLAPEVPLYRSVGKAFFKSERGAIEGRIAQEQEKSLKNQKDYMDRKEYLERRIASNKSNMSDIISS